jgi:hypothetical protein
MEASGQLQAPAASPQEKETLAPNWIRGRVGPRDCLDAMEGKNNGSGLQKGSVRQSVTIFY